MEPRSTGPLLVLLDRRLRASDTGIKPRVALQRIPGHHDVDTEDSLRSGWVLCDPRLRIRHTQTPVRDVVAEERRVEPASGEIRLQRSRHVRGRDGVVVAVEAWLRHVPFDLLPVLALPPAVQGILETHA